jgi:hypothetical protein
MTLTVEQQETIKKWLEEKLSMRNCPTCGQCQGFAIGAIIAAPVVNLTGEGTANDADISVPFVPLLCRNCGNVRLFSARTMGLIPEDSVSLPQ